MRRALPARAASAPTSGVFALAAEEGDLGRLEPGQGEVGIVLQHGLELGFGRLGVELLPSLLALEEVAQSVPVGGTDPGEGPAALDGADGLAGVALQEGQDLVDPCRDEVEIALAGKDPALLEGLVDHGQVDFKPGQRRDDLARDPDQRLAGPHALAVRPEVLHPPRQDRDAGGGGQRAVEDELDQVGGNVARLIGEGSDGDQILVVRGRAEEAPPGQQEPEQGGGREGDPGHGPGRRTQQAGQAVLGPGLAPRGRGDGHGLAGHLEDGRLLHRANAFLQRVGQLPGRGPAILGLLGQGLAQDVLEAFRQGARPRHELGRLVVDDLVQQGGDVLAQERPLAGQHFEEDDTQREDVGAGVDLALENLLRRHVGRCGRGGSGPGDVDRLYGGDAEVHQVGLARFVQEDVVGLDVAVDDAALVGVVEGPQDRHGQVRDLLDAELAARVQAAAEAAAGDVLHDDVSLPGLPSDLVDGGDVGVVQPPGRLGFDHELFEGFLALRAVLQELVADELDGDFAVDVRVERLVDDAHAPPAELFDDGVFPDRVHVLTGPSVVPF